MGSVASTGPPYDRFGKRMNRIIVRCIYNLGLAASAARVAYATGSGSSMDRNGLGELRRRGTRQPGSVIRVHWVRP